VRIALARPLVRWLLGNPAMQARVARLRAADLARGLDPAIAALLVLDARTGDSQAWTGSPARARHKLAASVAIVDDPPGERVFATDLDLAGPVAPIPARHYEPDGLDAPSPGLVYVHGGGWVTGDLDTHDAFCRRLAALGRVRVVSIAPRLAPEHPFPAAVDDTLAAFRDVSARAAELGIDADHLGLGGDSAGGNLAAAVGLLTRDARLRPSLTALLYPGLDATCSQPSHRRLGDGFLLTQRGIAWYLDHYLGRGGANRRDPRASPLLAPDLGGAPPALIVVAGFDPLVDEGEAYARRLAEAGADVTLLRFDALVHGFLFLNGVSPAALAATETVARRVGELLYAKGAMQARTGRPSNAARREA